jgi:hypothetical protein
VPTIGEAQLLPGLSGIAQVALWAGGPWAVEGREALWVALRAWGVATQFGIPLRARAEAVPKHQGRRPAAGRGTGLGWVPCPKSRPSSCRHLVLSRCRLGQRPRLPPDRGPRALRSFSSLSLQPGPRPLQPPPPPPPHAARSRSGARASRAPWVPRARRHAAPHGRCPGRPHVLP